MSEIKRVNLSSDQKAAMASALVEVIENVANGVTRDEHDHAHTVAHEALNMADRAESNSHKALVWAACAVAVGGCAYLLGVVLHYRLNALEIAANDAIEELCERIDALTPKAP
jgi:hypothetical protein